MAGDRKDETVGPPENLQDQLVEQIIANLRKVYDPELNLNVYDLGLIYEVAVNKEYDAQIIFTLTTPNCPAAEIIPMEIEFATRAVECINKVNVVSMERCSFSTSCCCRSILFYKSTSKMQGIVLR